MFNFDNFFEDQYQFTLSNVAYSKIDTETENAEYEVQISDNIETTAKGRELYVTFKRDVFFQPSSMFSLSVSFDLLLHFIEGAEKEAADVNWCKEFIENPNPFLGNVTSRVSHLIAEITSSFGQQPLITPPNPVINISDI